MLTAVTADNDADGQIDRIVVTFSEQVDITDGVAGDGLAGFSLGGGYTIANADYAAANTTTLTLQVTESGSPDTEQTPSVTYDGSSVTSVVDNATVPSLESVLGPSSTRPLWGNVF